MTPALRDLVELLARAALEELRREAERTSERPPEAVELRPEFTADRMPG